MRTNDGIAPGGRPPKHGPAVGSRSVENAIHCPSADQDGLKSPVALLVDFRKLRVAKSRIQRSACPLRVDTNAIDFASGKKAA